MKRKYFIKGLLFLIILPILCLGCNNNTKLYPDSKREGIRFGSTVCISGDSSTLVIGATREHNEGYGSESGSVYIYNFTSDSKYNFDSKLLRSDLDRYSGFGSSIALSGNGQIIAVGATENLGSVTIYKKESNYWKEIKTFYPPEDQEVGYFGHSIALSKDGSILVIGTPGYDSETTKYKGCAFIYKNTGNTWDYVTRIEVPEGKEDDRNGRAVSVSGNGSIIIIASDSVDNRLGAAYVFQTNNFINWVLTAKLIEPIRKRVSYFGEKVVLSTDSSVIAMGARGKVYIYKKNNNSEWNMVQKINMPHGSPNLFGYSLSFSAKAEYLLIGAIPGAVLDKSREDILPETTAGAAYMYEYSNEEGYALVKSFLPDDTNYDPEFGYSTVISADGKTIITGAYLHKNLDYKETGAVYIFKNK